MVARKLKREREKIFIHPVSSMRRLRINGKWYQLVARDIKKFGARNVEYILLDKRCVTRQATLFILKDFLRYKRSLRKTQD